MKTWIYRSTFRTRIWVSLVVFTVLSIVATGMSSYYFMARVLESKAIDLNQGITNKSAQALEEKLRTIRKSSLTFTLGEPFEKILQSIPGYAALEYYDHFVLSKALQTPIYQLKLMEPSISSILVHTPVGDFYELLSDKRTNTLFEDSILYEHLQSRELPFWIESHEDPLFESREMVISLVLESISHASAKDVTIVVNVSEKAIREFLLKNVNEGGGEWFLFNNQDKQVMNLNASPKLAGLAHDAAFMQALKQQEHSHFEYRHDKKDYYVNFAPVSFPDNWVLAYVQSKDKVLREIQYVRWTSLGIILILVPLALLLSRSMSVLLLRPMKKLQLLMSRVEDNNLSVRYESPYRDEFAQVGHRFNQMLEKISLLINDVKLAEKEKRVSEIKALQAQVNPHFLYNTLNTIMWKSEDNQKEAVIQMILSLSKLFRLGLNNGYELTTLGRELEHVKEYLELQRQCYEGLFTYVLEVQEESLLDKPVPKLLLQPLVENSILHGFEDMGEGGEIVIRIGSSEEMIFLTVRDNGKGFDVQGLQQQWDEPGGAHKGFALHNVGSRLRLYYDHAACLRLSSRPYERTEIQIRIPLREITMLE